LGFYVAAAVVLGEVGMFAFDAYLRTQDSIPYPPPVGAYRFWPAVDASFLLWAGLVAVATWTGRLALGWLAWLLYAVQAVLLGWSSNAPLGLGVLLLVVAVVAASIEARQGRQRGPASS
jgi:hypothetical protein